MLKEGSVLTDNTARAHEDNGSSFMECGQNKTEERGLHTLEPENPTFLKTEEDNYSHTQALPRASEERKQHNRVWR